MNRASGHQRKKIYVAVAAADCEFVSEQNVFFLAFGFRLGRVQPPGVDADVEQRLLHQVPVILAGFGIGGVVHRHAGGVIGRLGELELVDEPALLVHVVVDGRARLEEGPHRNHQVDIFAVQFVDHAFGVGIVLVEDVLAFAVPPEPVLHDVVERDVQVAILFRDAENFFLRFVAVLALPEAVGPLAEHREPARSARDSWRRPCRDLARRKSSSR